MSTTFNAEIQRLAQAKEDIKQAIEEKGVVVGNGLIDGYAEKIKQIKAAGKQQAKSAKVTKNNSTTVISPDDGYVGLDKVTVTTQIPIQDKKTIDIAVNGGYSVAVDEGYEGLKKVDIAVNVPIQDSKSLEVKKNGTYTISKDDEYEGMKEVEVVVDVQQASTQKLPNGISLANSLWETFDMNNYDWSDVYDYAEMFNNCWNMKTLTAIPNLKPLSADNMFYNCASLTSLDVSNWNTSKVADMRNMFEKCNNLTSINLSNWDTSNVTDTQYMFSECKSITSLDLSGWDLSKVTDMGNMFNGCSALTSLDLSNIKTKEVKSLSKTFSDCISITSVDLSSWDLSNVENFTFMFMNCKKLKEIKMAGPLNTTTYVNANSMFNSIPDTGTFYYDDRYDYSIIIAKLPTTWTVVPMTITE